MVPFNPVTTEDTMSFATLLYTSSVEDVSLKVLSNVKKDLPATLSGSGFPSFVVCATDLYFSRTFQTQLWFPSFWFKGRIRTATLKEGYNKERQKVRRHAESHRGMSPFTRCMLIRSVPVMPSSASSLLFSRGGLTIGVVLLGERTIDDRRRCGERPCFLGVFLGVVIIAKTYQ